MQRGPLRLYKGFSFCRKVPMDMGKMYMCVILYQPLGDPVHVYAPHLFDLNQINQFIWFKYLDFFQFMTLIIDLNDHWFELPTGRPDSFLKTKGFSNLSRLWKNINYKQTFQHFSLPLKNCKVTKWGCNTSETEVIGMLTGWCVMDKGQFMTLPLIMDTWQS